MLEIIFLLFLCLYLFQLSHSIAFFNRRIQRISLNCKDIMKNQIFESNIKIRNYNLTNLKKSISYYEVKENVIDIFINKAIDDDSIEPFGLVPWNATYIAVDILDNLKHYNYDNSLGTVVDLGCGVGISSIAVLALGAKHVYALDLNPDSLHLVRKAAQIQGYNDRLSTLEFDIEKYDNNDLPKCDLLILSDILYYPSLAKSAAIHCAKAMKQGSRVLITDPGRSTQKDFIQALKEQMQLMQLPLKSSSDSGSNRDGGRGKEEPLLEFKKHEVRLNSDQASSSCSGYFMLL